MVGKIVEDASITLVRLQTEQFAYKFVMNLRPKSPFDGVSGRIDFEQYLKKFEAAQRTPGLSSTLRLAEFEHWWVGVSGIKIARFLLREDKDTAIKEAIQMLKKEYGKRRTTADEMLEDLMVGEKVPQKDMVAVDNLSRIWRQFIMWRWTQVERVNLKENHFSNQCWQINGS